MKKIMMAALAGTVVLTSCGTYAGTGAYAGASLGGILGSAIGGISNGPRGSDVGTLIGIAGGAVVGGAIGQAQDEARQRDYEQYQQDKAERAAARAQQQSSTYDYDSGFDGSNSGDDRIYDFSSSEYTGNYSASQAQTSAPMHSSVEGLAGNYTYTPSVEIRNARFVDDNQDGEIQRGELSKIIFEVYNNGQQTITDVVPTVVETTGNKHLFISPSMHVESIEPGKGIRYTALVKADNRLKPGRATFAVSVIHNNAAISQVSEFNVPTRR